MLVISQFVKPFAKSKDINYGEKKKQVLQIMNSNDFVDFQDIYKVQAFIIPNFYLD